MNRYLFTHEVDQSLLKAGVTIPLKIYRELFDYIEVDLKKGEKAKITILMGCSSLKKLDLRHFNTRKVTDMHKLFSGCKSLYKLDISGFDTRRLRTDKEGVHGDEKMFERCKSLKRIALGKHTILNTSISGGKWTRTKLLNGNKPSKKIKIKLMKSYTGKYPGWYSK